MPTSAMPKNLRANDQASFITENRKDFINRKHGLSASQINKLCALVLVVLFGVTILVYNHMLIGSLLCVLLGILLNIVAKQIEAHQKVLKTTEFLNALFASSLSTGYKFCVIAKQDDAQIVYLDRMFQQMFPDMVPKPKRMLGELLSIYNAAEPARSTLLQAIKQGNAAEIPLQIQSGAQKQTAPITISVQPIERPSGFCLVRGR